MTPDRFIDRPVLWITIIVITAVTLALVVVTIIARAIRHRREHVLDSRLANVRPIVVAIAADDDGDDEATTRLSTMARRDRQATLLAIVGMLSKVRGAAAERLVEALRRLGAIDSSTADLDSRSEVLRARAVRLLGLTRDPAHVDRLIRRLDDPSAEVRLVAVHALGMIGDAAAAGPVLATLRSSPPMPASAVAEAVLAMGAGTESAIDAGLEDDDPLVRTVAARLAGIALFASTTARLRPLLATDPAASVRVAAATSLGQIGGPADVDALIAASASEASADLRHAAVTALGGLGDRRALEALAALLDDRDVRLAELAAEALAEMGPLGAAALHAAVDEPETTGTRLASPAAWILERRHLQALAERSSR